MIKLKMTRRGSDGIRIFFQIALILLSTKLAGDLSVRLGQPSVLGKLIVGIVIGPAILGWIENSELLTQLSNVGVILFNVYGRT